MNIEVEFDFGALVFGVSHSTEHVPEVIKGTLQYITVDKNGVIYSIEEEDTGCVFDFAGIDVTSDYSVAQELADNYLKQYKKDYRKYLEERIAITESNLERYRTALKNLEEE